MNDMFNRLLIILCIVGFIGVAVCHSGEISLGFYPPHNEFDKAGNQEPYTARYDIEIKERIIWNSIYFEGEGIFYFGNVYPSQGGQGNDSYRFTPLVADISGGLGYLIRDNWSIGIESGRTLDLGEWYKGDVYKWNKVKSTYRW